MSDRPTPETDAASWVETNEANALTLASFSRQLERQRDDARDQLIRICREGFGDQDTISLEPCADYVLRKLNEERELARELRDALKELADNGHTEECDKVNYANKHCDCGVDSARILISKAKEVLP